MNLQNVDFHVLQIHHFLKDHAYFFKITTGPNKPEGNKGAFA